ncbi:DNA mismatch repair endonuclease MutL [Halopenitus persicus]|uniref:DNA mismatch repair endonuclease MutL n=1 Tax=Halopenitus persicus TaxID=1048396 RepID=UPI000BBB52E9|nr:DNA mismatch repair endonuclease MutL [Halopenitus persicus]
MTGRSHPDDVEPDRHDAESEPGPAGSDHGTTDSEPRVRRLSERTVDRIAAGEVITRPARVVAELIDNALDAGATRVAIAVDGDGTDAIRVRDDGRGMSREDARLALERHATSKLRDGQDPVEAASLGFRGEALAAIAEAAGRLEVVTNDGGPVGTRIVAGGGDADRSAVDEGGVGGGGADGGGADGDDPGGDDPDADATTVADAGRARGTTVTVTDLFATRPARRESLAGPNAEFARISALVADYALARPDVAVTLEHDGSETLSTPGTGWTDAVLGVYDRDVASRSTTLDATDRGALDGDRAVEIRGILAYPSVTRATRDHVRVAVNGRPVSDAGLERAIVAGYDRLLPEGREPVAALDVRLPAGEVDPNVHPAKREVGLRSGDAVVAAVTDAVADALAGVDLRRKAEVATDLETALSPAEDASPFADVEPIGQYRDLYLLCDADDELLVIDAHAAHERVNYERLRRAFGREDDLADSTEDDLADSTEDAPVPDAVATLDPPATVSLTGAERAALEAHADALRRLGFDAEPFGGDLVRLRRVPAPFGRAADVDAFRDAVGRLAGGEAPTDPYETLLADLACHPSVKRGDALDRSAMRNLLDRLGECEQPFSCPHGRPTVLSIEEATLAAGFDRPSRG